MAASAAGAAQHELAELDDEAGLLGQRNEVDGGDQAALRMIPAQQRLEGDDAIAGDVADRLVVGLEFVALQRRAQIHLQQPPRLRARIHAGLEEAIGAAAVRLGAVQREVGVLQQLVRIVAVLRRQRDADRDADHDLMVVDLVRRRDHLDEAAGKGSRRGFLGAPDLDHGELVAAEPRHGVARADGGLQPAADFLEQRIADGMAERVVDVLEVIEIEAQHRELVARLRPAQSLLELLVEQHAVRQIGQRVMARHVRDLGLRLQPFGDVLEGRDPAAALHRLVDDADGATEPGDDLAGRAALARVGHEAREEFARIALPLALGLLFPQHVDEQAAGERNVGAAEHRRVALVEELDLAVRIEHAQSLRHVLERGIQHDLLASQFALGAAVEQSRRERDRDDRSGGAGGEDRQ